MEAPQLLPSPYHHELTVYPDRENYIVLPTVLMMRGTSLKRHAILIKSDIPINGMKLAYYVYLWKLALFTNRFDKTTPLSFALIYSIINKFGMEFT